MVVNIKKISQKMKKINCLSTEKKYHRMRNLENLENLEN